MNRGKFIVLEGIDKSGTTTQVSLLASYLFTKNKANSVFLTREPTMDSLEGKMLRDILFKRNTDPYADKSFITYMFLQDRIKHIEKIEFYLKNGTHVVSDRYKHSTIAYQAAQGLDFDGLIEIQKDFPVPDLTLILDINPEEAYKRPSTSHAETFDKADEDFHKKIARNYLETFRKLKNKENVILIDGSLSIEKVSEFIRDEVDKIL